MTCTVSGGTLNPTHSFTILATAGLLVMERPNFIIIQHLQCCCVLLARISLLTLFILQQLNRRKTLCFRCRSTWNRLNQPWMLLVYLFHTELVSVDWLVCRHFGMQSAEILRRWYPHCCHRGWSFQTLSVKRCWKTMRFCMTPCTMVTSTVADCSSMREPMSMQ